MTGINTPIGSPLAVTGPELEHYLPPKLSSMPINRACQTDARHKR